MRHAILLPALVVAAACVHLLSARAQVTGAPGAAGTPYPSMPSIAPIGERIGKYMDVPAAAVGPAVDAGKGYRLQDLGSGLHMVTDNAYQSMFLVYGDGVVVIDAPPSFATAYSGRHRGSDRQADHARGLQSCAH